MSGDWDNLDAQQRAQLIERLRQSGLRLDREGRWWHRGEKVVHAGLSKALTRWLDRLDDGRYVVRFDPRQYAYVEVEDAPFVVKTIAPESESRADVVLLRLSDETTEELDYDTLSVAQDNALYCRVHGRFEARFSRQAYYLLQERLVETAGGFALEAKGKSWPIRPRGADATRAGVDRR